MERPEVVQEAQPAAPETASGSAYHLMVAVTIMAAAAVIAAVLVSTRHYLIPIARPLAMHGWVRDIWTMNLVLTLGLLAPAAVLAGLAAGRRYRWVASAPAFLWIVFCWATALRARSWWPGDSLRGQLLFAGVWPVGAALLLYAVALLGARLGRAGGVRTALAAVLVAFYAWLGALSISIATMDTAQVLGLLAGIGAVTAGLVVTAEADARISRQTARFILAAVCGMSVFLGLAMVLATGAMIAEDRPGLVAGGAAAVVILVLVALLVRYRGSGRKSRVEVRQ